MAKANSQMFCRTILLLSFVAFVISLETLTKHDKYVLGEEDKKGGSSAEWLETVEESASKKALGAGAGYVYLIITDGAPLAYRRVKIGYSNNPRRRRNQLQVGSPWTLRVLNVYPVTNMRAAETRAKRAMRRYSVRGEWYSLPPGGIASVRRIVSRAIGPYKADAPYDVPRRNVRYTYVSGEHLPDATNSRGSLL